MRRETKFCTQIIQKERKSLILHTSFCISVLNSQTKYATDLLSFVQKYEKETNSPHEAESLNKNIVSVINNALMHCPNNLKFLALTRLIETYAVLKLQFSCSLQVFSCFSEPYSLYTKCKSVYRHLT